MSAAQSLPRAKPQSDRSYHIVLLAFFLSCVTSRACLGKWLLFTAIIRSGDEKDCPFSHSFIFAGSVVDRSERSSGSEQRKQEKHRHLFFVKPPVFVTPARPSPTKACLGKMMIGFQKQKHWKQHQHQEQQEQGRVAPAFRSKRHGLSAVAFQYSGEYRQFSPLHGPCFTAPHRSLSLGAGSLQNTKRLLFPSTLFLCLS